MTTIRARFRAPRKAAAQRPVSRAARMLALAHHVERLIDAGELAGYAEAARALGVTRARLTQVMNLLLLAPEIQAQVLVDEVSGSERRLRGVVAGVCWIEQAAIARATERRRAGTGSENYQLAFIASSCRNPR